MQRLPVAHLSKSSVELYADCARLWQGIYVEKRPRTRSVPLVLGSAFDAVLEEALRARAEGGDASLLTPAVLEARWRAAWRCELTGERRRFPGAPEPIEWGRDTPAGIEAEGRALVTAPATVELLRGLGVAVERRADGRPRAALQRRIELRLPGVPVPVIGFVDAILADGTPADFKTARTAWKADKAFRELQPRLYLLALRNEGYPLRKSYLGKWVFTHYVWSRRPHVRIEIHSSAFTDDDLEVGAEIVRGAWRGIAAGAYPANTGSWRCNYGCAVRAGGACLGASEPRPTR